jgi:type II secretion system protein N
VTESNASRRRTPLSPVVGIPIALLLIAIFIALLFPWDSVARRITHEIETASGSQIQIGRLRPEISARGIVLAAHDVQIEHPAVDSVHVETLEIAPRFSTSWFGAEPTLRIWADSELALIDGLLRLGESPSFVGHVRRVDIEKLPLRLDASRFGIFGTVSAQADVALDPRGVLTGRVDFESDSITIQTDRLPLAIPFTRAAGIIEMLPTGATRIESIELDGHVLKGTVRGEISMAHRSQSPPINLETRLQIVEPELRRLAPNAGIRLSPDGEASLRLRGTLDSPTITPLEPASARTNRRRS